MFCPLSTYPGLDCGCIIDRGAFAIAKECSYRWLGHDCDLNLLLGLINLIIAWEFHSGHVRLVAVWYLLTFFPPRSLFIHVLPLPLLKLQLGHNDAVSLQMFIDDAPNYFRAISNSRVCAAKRCDEAQLFKLADVVQHYGGGWHFA